MGGSGEDENPRSPPLVEASVAWTLVACSAFALIALFSTGEVAAHAVGRSADARPFICAAARAWRAKYPAATDLQIIISDVSFRASPKSFVPNDGLVVAPVGTDLPGAQDLLDTRSDPPALRTLAADAVTALSWAYAGRVNRDIQVTGLALVRRPASQPFAPPATPTFDALDHDLRADATLPAADLEEHGLPQCTAFLPWVRGTGGVAPYTEQLLRIVRDLAPAIDETAPDKKRAEDLCAALRQRHFSRHQAQVLAVMALRELGAPSYGLITTASRHPYVVATYVDGVGWITVDVDDPAKGYSLGGDAIVTAAPLIGRFETAIDGLWYPAGAAYTKAQTGYVYAFSSTSWNGDPNTTDTTQIHSVPLAEACP
jgi:hypothetical protein